MATWKERLSLFFVLGVMSLLLLRGIGDPSFVYPDADRQLMDGVFIHDFMREMPVGEIYEFTSDYYAQYPALSIGYRPPFFPFVEALFNGVFGINTWSSRLAILAFALVGITAWFKLVQRIFSTDIAFWASLLLVTTPFLAQWGWYTMGELPVLSMALLTAYVFYCYTENQRPGYLYATAILFSLTVWTKQTGVFLALWFLPYLAVKRQLLNCLKRRETWISLIIVLLLLTPLVLITMWLGDQHVLQSVGWSEEARNPLWRLHWGNLEILIALVARKHLTLPVVILSLIGMGWVTWRRDSRGLYFLLLILSTYVFFSYLIAKDARYSIFWIPAFTLFATLPFFYLRKSASRIVGIVVLASITVYQLTQVYAQVPYYATGYDKAARYVLHKNRAPTVFFDGYNNGYFIYFMRALDPMRSVIVLRGTKMLSSFSIAPGNWQEVHAHSREDIEDILGKYGTTHIVVESEDRMGIEIHKELRAFLESGPFRLVKEIAVKSNHFMLKGQTLKIYEYLTPKPMTADYLELRLPIVGQTLRVPIDRLRRRLHLPPSEPKSQHIIVP